MLSLDTSIFDQGKDTLSIFLDKPFWMWDHDIHETEYIKTNGHCCFNHLISLPTKDDRQYPLFQFQALIFETVEQNQNIWIKKARGIGVTTFMIRYLAWKILSSSELDDKSIIIVSGTGEELKENINIKLQQLFEKRFPLLRLKSKYAELWLKKTWIKVMTTRNIMDINCYFDAAFLFIDEADFQDHGEQEVLERAVSAYKEKSNGKTIMVSTPNTPGGFFEKIEKDRNSKYAKLKLDYTYGLGTIYDRAFIEKKRLEPAFEREYNLKYERR
jgi:hypothetical protein